MTKGYVNIDLEHRHHRAVVDLVAWKLDQMKRDRRRVLKSTKLSAVERDQELTRINRAEKDFQALLEAIGPTLEKDR